MDQDRCSRWPACQLEWREALQALEEEIRLEKREDHSEMWEALNAASKSVGELAVIVSGLAGRIVGYTAVASLVVGVVGFIAAKVFK